jgi:hypothetical protein
MGPNGANNDLGSDQPCPSGDKASLPLVFRRLFLAAPRYLCDHLWVSQRCNPFADPQRTLKRWT